MNSILSQSARRTTAVGSLPTSLGKTLIRATGRLACIAGLAVGTPALAGEIAPTLGLDFPVLGKVAPRHARDIAASPWSIGGETVDRDFTVFAHWAQYLGPLGAKGLRLQAGWAKCEKVKGVYSWAWLDEIVDGAIAQGVRPWLEFNYGNTIYQGGGDIGLGGGFPTSPEALAAWDRWCRALVERYKDRVNEWEVWNEPDLSKKSTTTVEAYVDLYIRTATIVRQVQPSGKVWALGLAGQADYADKFLAGMQAKGKLDLIDAITYHGYPRNPDDTTPTDRLRAIVAKYGRSIPVRQGETGAPSKFQENFALSKIAWTETTQAKWNLRRLLAHRAKDVPMNLFAISDMHYRNPDGSNLRMNYKGLLGTNPDQTISHVKPAYYAAQTVFAIFDADVVRIADFPAKSSVAAPRRLALTGYEQQRTKTQLVAFWFSEAPAVEENATTPIEVVLARGAFQQPVLVDVRTGLVYRVPAERWKQTPEGTEFRGLPAYDSPLLLAEASALRLTAEKR
jgi:hypothetical protein